MIDIQELAGLVGARSILSFSKRFTSISIQHANLPSKQSNTTLRRVKEVRGDNTISQKLFYILLSGGVLEMSNKALLGFATAQPNLHF